MSTVSQSDFNRREQPLDTSVHLNQFLITVERRAFRMARFAVSSQDDALDIVQDAMLDFVRKYHSRPAPEWPPLFYRVLQSKISDRYRRQSVVQRFRVWLGKDNTPEHDPDPIQECADSRCPDPLLALERSELGTRLEQVIRSLPLRQQQAFLLRAWEGLDVADTAHAMGCSEGSVKTHYFRAVHTLREQLEEYRHE